MGESVATYVAGGEVLAVWLAESVGNSLPAELASPDALALINDLQGDPDDGAARLRDAQEMILDCGFNHAKVSLATSMPVYFADPHSPWQRPSNENTNRLYREYLPKGTVIPDHQPYLTTIAEEINNRPRRRLGYLTPTEAFARLLAGEPHVASTP